MELEILIEPKELEEDGYKADKFQITPLSYSRGDVQSKIFEWICSIEGATSFWRGSYIL